MRTILFVCSGNTCRSPMAEAIARHWLQHDAPESLRDVFVASAGVSTVSGLPTSSGTLTALQQMNIEHDGRSKGLTPEMIRKADYLLCMTSDHVHVAREIIGDDPEHANKIMLLKPDADLEDPIGMGQDAYDRLARTLHKHVPQRIQELLAHENRTGIRSSG
jgi:protein-tyrosine-phosphatase